MHTYAHTNMYIRHKTRPHTPQKIIKRRGDGVRVKHLSYIGFYPRHQPKGKVKKLRQMSGTDVLHQSIKFCSTLRRLESQILQSR